MRRVASLLAGLALLGAGGASAQDLASDGSARVAWTIRLPGAPGGWLNAVTPLADGSFLAAGFTGRDDAAEGEDWQAFTLRFDADGRTRWRESYGAGRGTDALWDVEAADDGGFVGVGFTDRIGAGGLDGWVVRLDSTGKLVSEIAIGGPEYDRLTDVARLPGGGFIATGFTIIEGLGREVLLVRLSPTGEVVWRRSYGGPGDQTALYVDRAPDGGFVIAGGAPGGSTVIEEGDVLVMKVADNGDELWRRTYGDLGGSEIPHNLHVLADGRIRMTGYTDSWGAQGPHDLLALTLKADGEVLHAEMFGGPGDDRAMVSGFDSQGREWVTGYSNAAADAPWDLFLVRLDAEGRFEPGVARFGGPGNENGAVVRALADGSLLVGGYAGEGGRFDPVVMRVTAPALRPADGWARRSLTLTARAPRPAAP